MNKFIYPIIRLISINLALVGFNLDSKAEWYDFAKDAYKALVDMQGKSAAIVPLNRSYTQERIYCVDLYGYNPGDAKSVWLFPRCNPLFYEWTSKWQIRGDDNNLKIVLANTNFCLEYNANKPRNGSKIILWGCDNSSSSSWTYEGLGNSFRLRNNDDKNFCLDMSGADNTVLHLWKCHGGSNQKFNFYKAIN